ncbi:MARVEL domain-containing protein [Aspergillus stella-maris]|uniref:MARVEL domain-containing protein n=1 Tax=Aspergillus stella-maris TaxID=1810926 RepID=UPI003CCE0733
MWFLLLKIFRFGYSESKKYKAKKAQQNGTGGHPVQFQQPPDGSPYDGSRDYNQQPYPMDTYPPPLPDQTSLASAPMMSKRARAKSLLATALAVLQFAFGLAVIGLYSQDINSAQNNGDALPSRWVYAVVTAFLSTVTALLYIILGWWWTKRSKPSFSERDSLFLPLFAWESVLVILWLVVFGIFGEMYIGVYHVGGKEGGEGKLTRMRRAVWVDLACLVFWILSGTWRGVRWWKERNGGSFKRKDSGMFGTEKEMA